MFFATLLTVVALNNSVIFGSYDYSCDEQYDITVDIVMHVQNGEEKEIMDILTNNDAFKRKVSEAAYMDKVHTKESDKFLAASKLADMVLADCITSNIQKRNQ